MAWTLNGTRFYVQELNGDSSQIMPRLQPLSGGTIIQIFGYESEVNNINAIVVGVADKDALMALRKTGIAYELVSPEGSFGDYYVKKAAFRRIPNVCQTMRPDLAEDCEVYIMDFELFPESD
jgi:hypothetical protein